MADFIDEKGENMQVNRKNLIDGSDLISQDVLVDARVKRLIKHLGSDKEGAFYVTGDALNKLNNKVLDMINESIKKAKANNRRTVMDWDI